MTMAEYVTILLKGVPVVLGILVLFIIIKGAYDKFFH